MLDICHVSMDAFDDDDDIGWHKQELRGSFTKSNGLVDSDGKMYAKYLVELKDTDADSDDICTFVISLLQVGGRRRRAEGKTFKEAFAPIGKKNLIFDAS